MPEESAASGRNVRSTRTSNEITENVDEEIYGGFEMHEKN